MAGAKGFEPSIFSVTGRRVNRATPRAHARFAAKRYHGFTPCARVRSVREDVHIHPLKFEQNCGSGRYMGLRMMTVISDHRFERFVEGLDELTIAQTARMVGLLKQYGSLLEMPHSRALGRGFFELRIRGRREVRIIYSYHRGAYVLLHGFIKKTARIPRREMETAKARLRSFDGI